MAQIKPPSIWRNYATVTPDHDGETLLSIGETTVQALYKEHGAVLFRGFELDTETFRALTRRYCIQLLFAVPRDWRLKAVHFHDSRVSTGERWQWEGLLVQKFYLK